MWYESQSDTVISQAEYSQLKFMHEGHDPASPFLMVQQLTPKLHALSFPLHS
jgi:hypothetical protein